MAEGKEEYYWIGYSTQPDIVIALHSDCFTHSYHDSQSWLVQNNYPALRFTALGLKHSNRAIRVQSHRDISFLMEFENNEKISFDTPLGKLMTAIFLPPVSSFPFLILLSTPGHPADCTLSSDSLTLHAPLTLLNPSCHFSTLSSQTSSPIALTDVRWMHPMVQILSIPCSLWEHLAKSYAGAPLPPSVGAPWILDLPLNCTIFPCLTAPSSPIYQICGTGLPIYLFYSSGQITVSK